MIIPGKVRGHPVKQNTNALLVHVAHEVLKVLRRTETACRGIVTRGLISPRAIVGIFSNRQQFNVGKSHIFDICCQGDCQLPIGHETIFLYSARDMTFRNMPPGSQVDLINRDRRMQLLVLSTLTHPLTILPQSLVNVSHYTSSLGTQLDSKAVGICFIDSVVVKTGIDSILVQSTGLHPRYETFPHP